MILRMKTEDWGRLVGLLSVLDWPEDLKCLYQLDSIREIDCQKYCSVPDSLLNRLRNLQASLRWFDPSKDMSWAKELLGAIPVILQSEAISILPEPIPETEPELIIELTEEEKAPSKEDQAMLDRLHAFKEAWVPGTDWRFHDRK
jgi:hypothetical protein